MVAVPLGASWVLNHHRSSLLLADAKTFYTETQRRVEFNFPSLNSCRLVFM